MWKLTGAAPRSSKDFTGKTSQTWILTILVPLLLAGCGGPPQLPAEGAELPATLQLDESSVVNYPDTVTGLKQNVVLKIRNLSKSVPAQSLRVTASPLAPFEFVGSAYPGTGGTCSDFLNAGGQCLLELEIAPLTPGLYETSLALTYFDGLENQSLVIDLSAQARNPLPAILTLSPTGDADFGVVAVGGFAEINLALENMGEEAATAINFAGFLPPFSILNTDCGGSLGPDSQCQITLRYSPAAASVDTQVLQVQYFDGVANQQIDRAMQGEGRFAGFIAIDEGNSFDLGVILDGYNTERTLTLRNTGGGNASAISISGLTPPYSITSNSCPTTLTPAQSCSLTVRFSSLGTDLSSDALNISYSDGFSPQVSTADFVGQSFDNAVSLQLTNPTSSPSQRPDPTVRAGLLVGGLRVRLYQDALCTVESVNDVSAGTDLDLFPVVTEGVHEFHARVEDSDGNLNACSAAAVPYEYDISPSQPPTNIVFAQNFTGQANVTPSFSWTASPSGDVVDYQAAVSTASGGGNSISGWTSKGLVTMATESGLSLTECDDYYVSVRSEDHVGLPSLTYAVSTTPFRYDSAPPTPPSHLEEEGDGSINNSATVTWNPGSDACGVSHYEVAVSEDTNDNNLLDPGEVGNAVPFTNVGNITSHRFNSVSLTNGVAHFTSIRTVDTTGRASVEAVSDPWIVYDPSIELPDMIVWLDGNDPTAILDTAGRDALDPGFNGQVDRWLDKSGSATEHDFRLSIGATRPLYDDLNFSAVFNGSNTGMTVPNHPDLNTATVVQRNLTVAFRTSSNTSSRQVLYEEGGSIRGMNIYISNNDLYCGFYNTPASDGDGAQPFTWVNTPILANQTYFVTWVFDYTNYAGPSGPDGNLTCYVNGTAIGSVPSTSRLFAHGGNVGLGHIDNQACFESGPCQDSGSHFLGDIYEVMLFNNAPNAADVTNVHTYLDNKWN